MKKSLIALTIQSMAISFVAAETFTVYKSPTCGCCSEWIKIMEAEGHTINIEQPRDLSSVKESLGLPSQLASCHTAVANGYVFEGHIPVSDIVNFLENPPVGSKGLAVPGMPAHSPGMAADGQAYQNFKVIGWSERGEFFLFNEY